MTTGPDRTPVRPRFAHGVCTHVGMLRVGNEDSFAVGDGIFVVADGLGGHNAGEVASDIAARTLIDGARGGLPDPGQFGNLVLAANDAVIAAAGSDPELRGMATTVTALAAYPGPVPRVMVANVGDSRTSLYRAGDFGPVSVDHNKVQELVDAGELARDRARFHHEAHILTRALGVETTVEVDVFVLEVMPRDRFLLCSDGLTDEVDEEDIAEALWRHSDPQACADALVALANANGGHDNITVIVADVIDLVPAGA